jgi:hypothetical protein
MRRGAEHENRFLEAFTGINASLPAWFRGVRRATPQEDSLGIDALAITVAGEIPFQIKSSAKSAEEFRREHPGHSAIILVISTRMSGKDIRSLVVESIKDRFNP